jgi:hypothetical protein
MSVRQSKSSDRIPIKPNSIHQALIGNKYVGLDDESYIYYNCQQTNSSINNSLAYYYPQVVNYIDNQAIPIIESVQDYTVSVVKFQIPFPDLIFEFQNAGDLFVSFFYNFEYFSDDLTYVPWNLNTTTYGVGDQHITDFQQWCNIINTSLKTAFSNMKISYPALPQTEAPYVVFNNTTSKFEIWAQNQWIGGPLLYFSNDLFNKIPTIPAIWTTSAEGYQILLNNFGNNVYNNPGGHIIPSLTTSVGASGYFIVSQQSSVLGALFDPQGILFTTNSLPIKTEFLPLSTVSQGQASSNTRKLLTYFQLYYDQELSVPSSYQSQYIEYSIQETDATKISMIGQGPLNTIDLQAYWWDKYQNLYPIKIYANQTFTCKLQFSKIKKVR